MAHDFGGSLKDVLMAVTRISSEQRGYFEASLIEQRESFFQGGSILMTKLCLCQHTIIRTQLYGHTHLVQQKQALAKYQV